MFISHKSNVIQSIHELEFRCRRNVKGMTSAEYHAWEESVTNKDGIVDYCVEANSLDEFSLSFAKKIVANAPIALKSSKSAILASQYDAGFAKERASYLETLDSDDRAEGLKSFKEKRPPLWKNK